MYDENTVMILTDIYQYSYDTFLTLYNKCWEIIKNLSSVDELMLAQ